MRSSLGTWLVYTPCLKVSTSLSLFKATCNEVLTHLTWEFIQLSTCEYIPSANKMSVLVTAGN